MYTSHNPFQVHTVVLGRSVAARQLDEQLTTAARSDAKVLIDGESGAGKELAARLIHARSARRRGPFMPINCAAVSDTLLESELFGHARGSFTDAHRDSPGLLELARRGTLLLDEIGAMSMRMQSLLLRFLETGEIQRVGDPRTTMQRDVRVLAATNADLSSAIQSGAFRTDLFYRLNVLRITVPPLRERREDIPPLLEHFLAIEAKRHGSAPRRLSPSAAAAVTDHAWLGNVRELRNVAERLALQETTRPIECEDLSEVILARAPLLQEPLSDLQGLRRAVADVLFDRIVNGHEPFWSTVYDGFMSRDVTRAETLCVVRRGLEHTGGSFPALMALFNMEADDLRPFLSFLRKHQFLMGLQVVGARIAEAGGQPDTPPPAGSGLRRRRARNVERTGGRGTHVALP